MPNKYSVDDDNRLVIANNAETLPIDGTFSTDEDNRLSYWLNETLPLREKYGLPEKLVFEGNWKLNSNCDLELELKETSRTQAVPIGRLSLKGELISSESDKLIFELSAIDKNGLTKVRLLKLSGTWAADELNRIYFSVSKKESPDILTFQAGWQLNQNQQIIYTYQKANLKTKAQTLSTLTFSGHWQITSVNQLTYILSGGTNSKFDFKVQLETPNIYPKEGAIKYRIGIGLEGLSPSFDFAQDKQGTVPKIISLYGTWKMSRKLGVTFDMEYAKGDIQSLAFGAEVNFNKNNEAIFNLKNDFGENLGISVVFTHRF